MQALNIDWVAQPRRITPMGALLSVAALLCAVWVSLNWLDASDARDALLARQQRLARSAGPARVPVTSTPLARDDAQSAAQIDAQLARPWDALLHTLEKRSGAKVALLGLEVQGATRTLRLVGEAARVADVLDYVRALRQSPGLQNVYLSGQEEKLSGERKLLRFTVDASWSALP
jgi:Tfp pilus assembly protein PilN